MAATIDKGTSDLMDAIRGAGSLVVAAVHSFQFFVLPYFGIGNAPHLLSSLMATYAVLAFFVVSGFMISISVTGHSKTGSFNWRSFLAARVLRIYPPLIVALLISALCYWVIVGFGLHGSESFRLGGELFVVRERVELTLDTVLATLFLSYGTIPHSPPPISLDGSLWTLGYEFWFYILCMLLLNVRERRLLSGVVPFIALVLLLIVGDNSLQLNFLIVWAAGYGLGVAYQQHLLEGEMAKRWLSATTILCVGLIALLGRDEVVERLLNSYGGSRNQQMLAATGVMFTAVLGLAISFKVRSSSRLLGRAAGYSYSLYVLHWPLYILAFSLLHPTLHGFGWEVSFGAALIVFALVVVASSLAARVVENRATIIGLLARARAILA